MAGNIINGRVAVVIPCYKVSRHLLKVLEKIGPEVWSIYVIDDACPEGSGQLAKENCTDQRLKVIFHDRNQGVGGAVITGIKAALADGAGIIVKIDGDGQMEPKQIADMVEPIAEGVADYTKGNRFYDPESVRAMPGVRLFGNAVLSLMTKVSTGYWNLFDPTNGFVAIHESVARLLPYEKISRRYFFETDMLFRLNTIRAVVVDVPMDSKYGDEKSNMKIKNIIGEFLIKHIRNLIKRIFYNYYLRDVSLASLELPLGLILTFFSLFYGGYHWIQSSQTGVTTPAGTVMLSALPLLMGLQLLLAFVNYDIGAVPKKPRRSRSRLTKQHE